jgi:periplasmic protein TonB
MASSEELTPSLPDTLPEDFSEWDGQASAAASLGKSSDRESASAHSPQTSRDAKNEFGQSAERKSVLSRVLDLTENNWPAVSEPRFAKPEKSTSESAPESSNNSSRKLEVNQRASERPVSPNSSKVPAADEALSSSDLSRVAAREADRALFEAFSTKSASPNDEPKKGRNKWVILAACGAGSILLPLILVFSFGHHGARAAVNQPVQPTQVAYDSQTAPNSQEPAEIDLSTQTKPSAATQAQQQQKTEQADTDTAENSAAPVSEVQTQMMNDQLTAPRMISQDMKKQVAENAPPPANFGAVNSDGLGGNGMMGGVFNGHAHPAVAPIAVRPLTISSGVATGMLIQKTPPVYPTIAKSARVSGTVELHAVISKAGTIKDLKVENGPVMLQQAALDAVRTWRYKPYKLNNDPVEVETTISVVFTLGN